jgi:phosphotransferase system IIA component
MGKTYHFSKIDVDKIKSPISGKILKVFNDERTVLISNICGLQIILRVEKNDDDFEDGDEILLSVKKNDHLKKGDALFLLNNKDFVKSVTLYIP